MRKKWGTILYLHCADSRVYDGQNECKKWGTVLYLDYVDSCINVKWDEHRKRDPVLYLDCVDLCVNDGHAEEHFLIMKWSPFSPFLCR